MLTTTNGSALLVDDVYNLVVRPTLALTAAGDPRVTTTVTTSSHTLRVPIMATDPSAAWVAEGAEIPVSPDAVLTELDITPSKLAGLSIVTNELAADSTPEASAQVGMGLARDLARKLDAAFVGNVAAPAPAGLAALSGVQSIVNANAFTNLDVFSQAISLAESVGAQTTAFLTGPDTALALAQLKLSTGSNASLLGQDPSRPTGRVISGVPVVVSPSMPANTVWAIAADRVLTVVRQDATVVTDGSVFFTSDRLAIRATMRAAFGFPHPASLVKITKA